MIVYVTHAYGGKMKNMRLARKITYELQEKDPNNTYICPLLALPHIEGGKMDEEAIMENRIDLLSVCDKLIVASKPSNSVQEEIDFARIFKMEVEYLEDAK